MVGEDPPEGFPAAGIWIPNLQRMGSTEDRGQTFHADEVPDARTVGFLDLEHDLRQQVFDSLNRAD
jgi:hypothetical protein